MPATKDEATPLLEKRARPWLGEYEEEPIGGYPGNRAFRNQVMLALRCSFFATLLGTLIWIPAMSKFVSPDFLVYVPVSVMMIFFNINPVFGGIIAGATAALIGTSIACLNIFMLRGFFPDGVQVGMSPTAPAVVVGWLDIMLFNFILLTTDVRMGVRMFAMAGTCGNMLVFLNPNDKSSNWDKNFDIHPGGNIVTCLKVTLIACCMPVLANLLPFPFGFAYADMAGNAKRVSAYMAKNFIGSVDYYRGAKASVMIERQMAQTAVVATQIGGLGASIGAAWFERFDLGVAGTVRKLHEKHQGLLGEVIDIANAIEIAISTEDFADSHKTIMSAIGESSADLADSVGKLMMLVTEFSADGEISSSEKGQLVEGETAVANDMKKLAKDFDTVRRQWDPIHKEVMNESFFVFALSAYGRKVCEYSTMLRTNPPPGDELMPTLWKAAKSAFTLEGVGGAHSSIVTRCWLAIMLGFAYGVFVDKFGGACAITIVFLQSNRVAPDVLNTLNVLTAVAVSSCCTAILYSRSCGFGENGTYVLPVVAFLYWWVCLYINFSGSSFATIGLLSAALSPFVLIVRCPPADQVSGTAAALPLWIGIRGFMIALFIMSVAEYLSCKDTLFVLAWTPMHDAMLNVEKAFKNSWRDRDPSEALAPVAGQLNEALVFGKAAVMEPRTHKCRWKFELLSDVVKLTDMLRLDILTLRHAMCGADGETGGVFEVLERVPPFQLLKGDLIGTLEDAREITSLMLKHEYGKFDGLRKLGSLDGLDTLDGFDETVAGVNKLDNFGFPDEAEEIKTMEDDLLAQISIVFVMLDFATKRVAGIIGACVRKS